MKSESFLDNQALLNAYYGSELRHLAQKAEKNKSSDNEHRTPVTSDWDQIRADIRKVSNPPAMGIDKFGASGMLGFITSYADESIAAAAATAAALSTAELTPHLLQAENANALFGTMLLFQIGWVRAGIPSMKEAWKDLKEFGVCTSPTAKSFYDTAVKLTKNETLQKSATYTGYWFWNGVKEIPWWLAGGYAVPAALSGLSYDVDPKASMSIFLMGACVGSSAYQLAQYGAQRWLRNRRESTKINN